MKFMDFQRDNTSHESLKDIMGDFLSHLFKIKIN